MLKEKKNILSKLLSLALFICMKSRVLFIRRREYNIYPTAYIQHALFMQYKVHQSVYV